MDWVPVLSQVKSLGYAIVGDMEKAKAAQHKFVKTCPVISQVTSAVHAIAGNNDLATEVQVEFLETMRDTLYGPLNREENSSESFPDESSQGAHPASKSDVDWIPVASQFKSLLHAIAGDLKQAEAVQQNFVRRCPVISQVTSAVHAIGGNNDVATEVQLEFLRTMRDDARMITPVALRCVTANPIVHVLLTASTSGLLHAVAGANNEARPSVHETLSNIMISTLLEGGRLK